MTDYKNKYFKYKHKYLNNKNLLGGTIVNTFSDFVRLNAKKNILSQLDLPSIELDTIELKKKFGTIIEQLDKSTEFDKSPAIKIGS